MNEPQVWTLIGIFATAIFGVLTFGFASVKSEMKSMRNELITRMDSGFATLNTRIDHLDRDVAFLMRKEFGENPSN